MIFNEVKEEPSLLWELVWQLDNVKGLVRGLLSFSNDGLSWAIVAMNIVPAIVWGVGALIVLSLLCS